MPIPLILPSSSTASGTTRATIRERLAETLGYFASGTVTTLAASLEAERYILSSSMRSDGTPPEHFDGLFAYIRDGAQAGAQRRLVNGGWDGPVGSLMVDYPYDAALTAGTGFELSVLPAEAYQGLSGLNDLINLGLEQLPVIDKVSVTVTATSSVTDTQYDLSGYAWPIKSVRAVYYSRTSTTSDSRLMAPHTWVFDQDAESPMLSFVGGPPASVGDAFEVEVLRPANTRIRQSGAWGDATTGMTADDDECLYDALTVVNMARPIALERLAHLYPRGSKERMQIEGEAEGAHVTAAFSKFYGGFRSNGVQKVGAGSGSQRFWDRV